MFSEDPYTNRVYATLINLIFVITLGMISIYRAVFQRQLWNVLYSFEENVDKTETVEYLVQFTYNFDPLTVQFASCDFILTFYSDDIPIQTLRIPAPFFGDNYYSKVTAVGEKIQFQFVTNKPLGTIDQIGVNHNSKKGAIKIDSIVIQKTKSNESYMVMIDKFIRFLDNKEAQNRQIFDAIKRNNPLPESQLTVDTDHCIWIYMGPMYFFLNRILLQNLRWLSYNYSPDKRFTTREFIEFECYHYAISSSMISYFLVASSAQLIYTILNQICAGKPRWPRSIAYSIVNFFFFAWGGKLLWHIFMMDESILGVSLLRYPQRIAGDVVRQWMLMNLVGTSAGLLFVLPFHLFAYNYVSRVFFLEINHYDLSQNVA